ncbi:hypothetical protein BJP48_11950 [Paenibacillus odorifer]|nr:hypothetical protein BJP48_11950 [Paenibacillus odorifer]
MALTKSVELDSGVVVDNAYIRIQGLNGNKDIVSIHVEVFATQELCEQGKIPVSYMSFTFKPSDEENALRWDKQAYEYLKTLSEFEGATDVLE